MNKKISNKFVRHVHSFMKKFNLVISQDKIVLSVSGGVDSMALLSLFLKLRGLGFIKDFSVITFDHGLRPRSIHDAHFVVDFCHQQGVTCELISFNLTTDTNIEMVARQSRQNIYNQYCELGYYVYLAHHIDDAFEWKLLQQFKTSTPSLGIPLVRGNVIRPFMCVTKKMITDYAKATDLPFVEDSSNSDQRFERNYLRNTVIPAIKKRFPAYRKHFVFQMNQEAIKQRKFRLKQDYGKNLMIYNDELGGVSIYLPEKLTSLSLYKDQIINAIKSVSNKTRGSLTLEVDKLCEAYLNNKKGPMSFAGNVGCFITQGALYLYPKDINRQVNFSEYERVKSIDSLWKFSYIEINNSIATKLCSPLKRCPLWLDDLNKKAKLIATADLYTQVYITKRVTPNKLIDCNFRSVRLI